MNLQAPPGSPLVLTLAADALLALHIGGGLVGIGSGMLALTVKKGGRVHRVAGQIFFVSMLIMAAIGAAVSPLIGQPWNTPGGVLAFYLVVTGWLAVRRPPGAVGRWEIWAMAAPLAVVAAMAAFVLLTPADIHGERGGVPAPAPFVLAGVSLLAVAADLSVVLRKGLAPPQRLARHLWRLCAALLIATASLFLGQPKVFPPALRGSPVMALPELFVAGVMIWHLARLAFNRWRRTRSRVSERMVTANPV